MKLTEAVEKGRKTLVPRTGAELYPPCAGSDKYGGCYRGMALVGAGAVRLPNGGKSTGASERLAKRGSFDLMRLFAATWPWTMNDERISSPCTCADGAGSVAYVLTHLWDKHVLMPTDEPFPPAASDPWTFERITDWVRSIEPKDEK